MRQGLTKHRDPDHRLAGLLAALADGVGHFVGLAEADAYTALAIAHNHQRAEGEPTTALHHLAAAVDADHALFELAPIGCGSCTSLICHGSNSHLGCPSGQPAG
jgi:hypothetical protein